MAPPLLLAVVLFLVFQAVFAWAELPMDAIQTVTAWFGETVGAALPKGWLRSLVVDGVIGGAGGVVVFLPQIVILFFFILVLEEAGYLPRAAYLLDRLMGGVGLSGRFSSPCCRASRVLGRFTAGGQVRSLMMERPSHHWPTLRNIAIGLWKRTRDRAGDCCGVACAQRLARSAREKSTGVVPAPTRCVRVGSLNARSTDNRQGVSEMRVFHTAIAAAIATVLAAQALAAPVTYDNEAAFRAAAAPTTTYGFESHGVIEGVDQTSPLPAAALDNRFDLAYTGLNAFQIIDNGLAAGVADGTHYLFTHSQAAATSYSLIFSNFGASNTSITAFGLSITDFASNLPNDQNPYVIAYDTGTSSGTLFTSFGGSPDFEQIFVGLTVDPAEAFTSITLTMDDIASGFQDFDEVIYSQARAVSEPGTLALVGLVGLGVLGSLARRRALAPAAA